MKVLTVIGARPQFIKAAVVSAAFSRVGPVEELLLHTGQHYDQDMSDVFFDELGIPVPKYNLGYENDKLMLSKKMRDVCFLLHTILQS